jgi:hypothetical protein
MSQPLWREDLGEGMECPRCAHGKPRLDPSVGRMKERYKYITRSPEYLLVAVKRIPPVPPPKGGEERSGLEWGRLLKEAEAHPLMNRITDTETLNLKDWVIGEHLDTEFCQYDLVGVKSFSSRLRHWVTDVREGQDNNGNYVYYNDLNPAPMRGTRSDLQDNVREASCMFCA